MNPAQLLAHFDRMADARDAIPWLRRFVLDLAVRGKLVPQDPADEPAVALLRRITAERSRLVKEKEVSRDTDYPEVPFEDEPFARPSNWEWVRLGKCLRMVNGRAFKPTDWLPTGLPIVRIQNLNSESAPFNHCDPRDVDDRHIIGNGAFLISWSGTPGTSFGAFIWQRGKAALNQHIFKCFQIGAAFDDRFLRLAINGRLDEMISKAHGGVGLQHITKGELEKLVLSLPPLAEQCRIVAKVDELMALCDKLEAAQAERECRRGRLVRASLNRLNQPDDDAARFRDHARFTLDHLPRLTTRPELILQLRQTILNLAVHGKLVPQDPNDEPAIRLLKRIQAERERLVIAGEIKRFQTASPISGDDLPAIPNGWEWVRLNSLLLCDSQNGYSKKPDDAHDGIPILRISAGTVRKDGIVAEEEHKLIGGVAVSQQQQFSLNPGDLLACRFNGNRGYVGRLSLYTGYLGINPIYPDKLIRLRLVTDLVLPKLVRCFAESVLVRHEIEDYCATTVGNWGISASNLKDVRIPLAPLGEQHRIVARVDELMALCDRLESQLTTSQTESRRLLEAVLHEALAG